MEYISRAYEILREKLLTWLENFASMLPNFMVAFLLLALFFIFSLVARRMVYRLLEKTSKNETVNRVLSRLVALMVFLFGLFIALDIINLDKTFASLLAGAGILGLAFSLGFQDVVANFVSGIMIATRRPYLPGDLIESNNIFGTVIKINMRSTHILTQQGQIAMLPNRLIYQNTLLNYTRVGKRRVDLQFGAGYHENLPLVEDTVTKAIEKLNYLLPGTNVEFFFREFGESSVRFEVRYWIKFSRQTDYLKAVSDGIKNIKAEFNEKGIVIPYPVRTINLNDKEILLRDNSKHQ